ncbi:hypothetical protein LZG00_05650 [Rhodobacteraceae bacterium LMO-12]|nr:hypothetical protein [Rhodobacteraceae bacterium LMO-JJ12]
MAYLAPQTLTCPVCAKTGEITWVVGIGPHTKKGDGPSYKTLMKPGPWLEEALQERPFWAGRLICPDCGENVKQVPMRTADRASGDSQE